MILCTSGLFVGIDRQPERAVLSRLAACGADATRLATYLQAAYPFGSWSVLVESAVAVPRRREVLRAIVEWTKSVQPRQAGVLYFAGHGENTSEGLILVPADFDASIPLDSGIPLKRVFEIIKSAGTQSARFVLLVDSCRLGVQARSEDTPSNVVVVYACLPGQAAAEEAVGSFFATAFVRSMHHGPRLRLEGLDTMPLASLLARVEAEYSTLPGVAGQRLEIAGSDPSDVLVPVGPLTDSEPTRAQAASAFLESRVLDPSSYAGLAARLRRAFKSWNGYELRDSPTEPVKGEAFIQLEGKGLICFPLPTASLAAPPHGFLSYILSTCYSVFYTLRIEYPWVVPHSTWRLLCARFGLEFRQLSDDESLVSWAAGRTRGQLFSSSGFQEGASLEVSCRSEEGNKLPLEMLLPSLNRIYDALMHLRQGGA